VRESGNTVGLDDLTRVFFYGLFMDEGLLEAKGVRTSEVRVGCVSGYELRIGQRATLVPAPGAQAWGVLMTLESKAVDALYREQSVADYRPEAVTVELIDGQRVPAVCYNLPSERIRGTNPTYARSLLALATRLALPHRYLEEIRSASGGVQT
jgi:hypothetical protein